MTAILKYESRRQLRGSILLGGLLFVFSLVFLAIFPGIKEETEALEDALPEYMIGLLGFEELHTIEGYTSGYLIPFLWVLLVGIFVAYIAASMVSGDIRTRRMDLLLSSPVSREMVIFEKFAALWLPLVILNGVLFVVIAGGSFMIGESIEIAGLLMAQLLAIPYLLVCGAIGLVFSVVFDRVETAQAGSIGAVFVLYMLEGVGEMEPDYEILGMITPSWYYDATAILVHGEYHLGDAGILLIAALVLIGLSTVIFVRRDI